MTTIIQAVKDRIVVEVMKKENKTDGGIIIPESASSDPQKYGKVISVGEEVKEIKENDVVTFNERAGMDFTLDKKLFKTISVNEIFGIVKEV